MTSLIGRTLGPYEILEQLGAGGMATIYKAHHAVMGRYVAIKVLPHNLAHDETIRARFRREVKTIARLEHRYILPVYDVGEYDGVIFMVMRYIEGGTLSDLIGRGPLPAERVVEIIGQVGEALAYAHRQGVIHRDIKPQNILIDRDGNALLSDFGIAKVIIEGTMHLTGEGTLLGTPYYMAPEQVSGQPIDGRADIYSLGVVLYEAFTGRRPFTADTPLSIALMHLYNPLRPPRQINPAIPEAIERVILKALEKDPDARYQTADEMVDNLRAALDQTSPQPTLIAAPRAETAAAAPQAVYPQSIPQPTIVHPQTAQQPTIVHPQTAQSAALPAAQRRRPAPWIIAGGVAAAVLIALLLLVVLPKNTGDSSIVLEATATAPAPTAAAGQPALENTATTAPRTAEPGVAPTAEPTATLLPTGPVGRETWRFQAGKAINTIPAYSGGTIYFGSEDGRIYAVDSASGQAKWTFETQDAVYSSPVVAGGVVYAGSWDSYLYALDATSGAELWKYKTGARIWGAPAAAGDTVYVGSDDYALHAIDAGSGELRWTFQTEDGITSSVAVAGDTVYVGGNRSLYAVDAASGELRWAFETGDAVRSRPAVVNGVLYVGCDNGALYALDAATGQERWRFQTGDRVWSAPAIDGGLVYVGSWDRHIYAVDIQTGEERWRVETADKVASSPAIADGVLYIGGDAGLLYALDSASGEQRWTFAAAGFVGSPIIVDGTIYVGTSQGYLYAVQ